MGLVDAGYVVATVDYRRIGQRGGGWPGTFDDLAALTDAVPSLVASALPGRVDTTSTVLVGHSAGGHLALLAGARTGVPVVALAAVSDPPTWENDAVAGFFGGTPPPPEASPLAGLPLGVPQILVHGTADDVVPFEQSERYVRLAAGEAELIPLEGAGHFEPIDPLSPEWTATRDALHRLLA